jgi:hypothetical protein
VSVGFRPPSPQQEPPRPRQLRVLWRMQGPQRVVAAALYEHPTVTLRGAGIKQLGVT